MVFTNMFFDKMDWSLNAFIDRFDEDLVAWF